MPGPEMFKAATFDSICAKLHEDKEISEVELNALSGPLRDVDSAINEFRRNPDCTNTKIKNAVSEFEQSVIASLHKIDTTPQTETTQLPDGRKARLMTGDDLDRFARNLNAALVTANTKVQGVLGANDSKKAFEAIYKAANSASVAILKSPTSAATASR